MNFKKIIIAIILFFNCIFINLGYAYLTNENIISGSIHAVKPAVNPKLYISNVSIVGVSNVTSINTKFSMPTIFDSEIKVNSTGGTIIYELTLTNDSHVSYWLKEISFLDDIYSNNLIGKNNGITMTLKDKLEDSGSTFNNDDWIPANTNRQIYAVYRFGSDTLSYDIIYTSINLEFEIRMDAVYSEFLDILNDPEALEIISAKFDETYQDSGQVVIGNIGDDKEFFNSLFGENLTINVDGEEKEATIMIRKENVDNTSTGDDITGGPSGCEYVVYISVDDLNDSNGEAIVYAITYVQDEYGQWNKLGQLYEGTASKENYDSSNPTYDGGFDVYSWQAAPKEYEVVDGITYKVGQTQGDQYDKLTSLEDLNTVKDQDIFNEIDNSKFFKKVYDIVKANENSQAPEDLALRLAFQKASPYYAIYNNGQEVKVSRNCSRAQIISALQEIQEALDYYYQVHNINM